MSLLRESDILSGHCAQCGGYQRHSGGKQQGSASCINLSPGEREGWCWQIGDPGRGDCSRCCDDGSCWPVPSMWSTVQQPQLSVHMWVGDHVRLELHRISHFLSHWFWYRGLWHGYTWDRDTWYGYTWCLWLGHNWGCHAYGR